MSKHTPGPWVVSYNMGVPYITAEQGKKWDNPTICNLYEDVTPEDSVTCGSWLEEHDNAEANALLIAAAPELLEALQALEPLFDGLVCYASTMSEYEPNRLIAQARAAIAKATGEQ